MRTTIDIADAVYADLKSRAAREQTTVKALITAAVNTMLDAHRQPVKKTNARRSWPVIKGGNPEALAKIDNDAIFGFDDE